MRASNLWTEQEECLLIDSYLDLDKDQMKDLLPSRTWEAIRKKAKSVLGKNSTKRKRWSEFEERILSEFYCNSDIESIRNRLPARAITSIKRKASSMGLSRMKISHDLRRRGSLKALLSKTSEAYYWLGFLAADGWFGDNG